MKNGVKVKLMHIVLSLNVGGLEMVVINLLKGLDRRIYTPILCCLEEEGSLIHEIEKLGVKTIVLGKKKKGIDYPLLFRLASILRQEKIDIIHSHNPTPYFYGTIAGKIANVPVIIYTKHGRNPVKKKRELLLRKFLSYMTDKIVAVSDDARNVAINDEKINPEKVVTIFNGIDIDRYQTNIDVASKKREIGLSDDDFVIGIVARLSPEKDHNTLFEAFRIVLDSINQNVKLVIVGDGILREEFEQKAKSISISNKTIFLGERYDVPELLAIFDLFILSSITEGISLTLLEAMATGLPVVATNAGGNAEIVLDNQTGFIVPPKDPNRMAEAIMTIIKNNDMANQMKERGKDRVSKKFNLETMRDQYEQIYQQTLLHKKI